mgnify:CR=1 FL=1
MYIRYLILPLAIILLTLIPLKSQGILIPVQEVIGPSYKNTEGEYCCGIADCGMIDPNAIGIRAEGYKINGNVFYGEEVNNYTGNRSFTHKEAYNEIIPYSKTQKSPDSSFWRCKRPDGSMRCFFAPPPGS